MLVVALVVVAVLAVGAAFFALSRARAAPAPPAQVKRTSEPCPDCGSPFVFGVDKKCGKCGRDLTHVARSVPRLPEVMDDDENDPQARTVVATSRLARMNAKCEACGAALEGASVCPKCGERQG